MKTILSIYTLLISCILLHANEDHLVLVPTPIIIVGDDAEHEIIQVAHISGYGLDFIGYCGRITDPYIASVNSPSSTKKSEDINPLSLANIRISASEDPKTLAHLGLFTRYA